MRAIAAGENRVLTVEDMERGSQRIRELVSAFDAPYP